MQQNHLEGKNHVSIQAGGDVNAPIHIDHVGDVYAPHPLGITYAVEKVRGTSVPVPSIQKFAGWAAFSSLLTVVANAVAVLGFFGVSVHQLANVSVFLLVGFGLSYTIWITCRVLRKSGRIETGFCGWTMTQDSHQRLIFEKVSAICPICGGRVLLRSLPQGSNLPYIGVCEREPHLHLFTFDRTTMSGDHCSLG
jgi:hypothetical protein